ncbi:MAG TPA: thioesterase family protein [Chloroflexia bacterium]|nr:thioesterase family protein [Chloroflexia bacterium]
MKELEEERNEAYEGPLPFIAEAYLRPRYAETDAQGVVYHSNYIVWFEVARGEYCRAVDYPYLKIEQEGYGLMVTEIAVKYHSPCRYDDEIRIKAWIEKVGRASCVFGYQVFNDTTGKLSVEGLTKHAAVTPAGKLTRFSQPLYAIMLTRAGRGPSQLAPTK